MSILYMYPHVWPVEVLATGNVAPRELERKEEEGKGVKDWGRDD